MKKHLIIIVLMLSVISSLVSCTSNAPAKTYQVFENWDIYKEVYDDIIDSPYIDNNSMLGIQAVPNRYYPVYEVKNPPVKTRDIEINGVTYTVNFVSSSRDYLYESIYDQYSLVDKDGTAVRVEINNKTDKIDRFHLRYPEYMIKIKEEGIETKSLDECLEIANKYLNEHTDAANYNLIGQSFIRQGEGYPHYYSFSFQRVINGFKTLDIAHIDITEYGDVHGHFFKSLGSMKGEIPPDEKQIEDIKLSVYKKLDSIYSDEAFDSVTVSYSVKDIYFLKLPTGELALQFDVSVKRTPKDPSRYTISELKTLIVPYNR